MDNYKELFDIHSPINKEAFVNKLMIGTELSSRRNARVFRPALIVAVFMLIAILTGTALAATSGFLHNLFGNNPAVLENIQDEVNFKVLSNRFEGINFEVTGLYADSDSILLVINATAQKAIFSKEHGYEGLGMVGLTDYTFYCPSIDMHNLYVCECKDMGYECDYKTYDYPRGFISTFYIIHYVDEFNLVLTWFFSGSTSDIIPGDTHKLSIGSISHYFIDEDGNPVMCDNEVEVVRQSIGGYAKIEFTVNELTENNHIRVTPNITLESGDVLLEVIVNPFNIIFYFEGKDEYESFNTDESYIRMKDGTKKDLKHHHGNSFVTGMSGGPAYVSTHHGAFHPTYLHISFAQDQTIVINDIEAIVYKGIEMLVP